MSAPVDTGAVQRRRVAVEGVVQGVGFRPFVFGLATELGLAGHVTNTGAGVLAEVEGSAEAVRAFCHRIRSDAPPLAEVHTLAQEVLTATGDPGFTIVASRDSGTRRAVIPPDTATCADCLAELADPADRRHRHPFITCTNCGPRYTIVTGLPYDRARTTMARFPMCADCAREYGDPADRRFHAQPIACHACGPRLGLIGTRGRNRALGEDAMAAARRLLADGAVLAVKGIGGYHLACDAADPAAVAMLRRRKARGDKPFALMAGRLSDIEELVHLGEAERRLLTGAVRPIVLMRRRAGGGPVAEAVAPRSPDLGVMLPYTPLHRLLFGLPGDPPGPRLLVMTSGNLSGEPIITDDGEALERLAPLTDAWLMHDRPIHVPCDDSVVRVWADQVLPVRRSRGYAPLPVALPLPVPPVLATGGDLKNTFALAEGRSAWLSGHIGDMDDLATLRTFDRAVEHVRELTGVGPTVLATDRHPGYRSSQWAVRRSATGGSGLVRVQHHHAHIASVMTEHGLDGSAPVIGVAFDGTGYGDDGAVWGGEVLLADYDGFRRFARLAYVPLPGGDAAVERPYRMALAHLHTAGLPWSADLPCTAACTERELLLLKRQLERNLNCVPTSSMGRLFDAVSSLAGVCHRSGYEAQAAVELEAAAASVNEVGEGYGFELAPGDAESGAAEWVADPSPVLAAVVADLQTGAAPAVIALRFHRAVAGLVHALCVRARRSHALETVALSGGVFANTLLLTDCVEALRRDGFTVLVHHRVPPNDGGLALGQLMVAARTR
ncbi:carbamoyltransferase HypF [Saccharothrix sp. ST-888]|uniref:carbamoyltransferase HypF n=1 Tax=Saccharothrix sp. ST-888 TaxID=1427391 RepID=UPI0005ECAE08|nr:carbamoyltransferase HypF [Saccharothrix sp. ST-888]KJK59358.1 hydrogenase maturation protein HypF [Saccharothrix sp. ST-888]